MEPSRTLIAVAFVTLLVAAGIPTPVGAAAPGAWDDWAIVRLVSITNPGPTLTDFEVEVAFDSAEAIAGGLMRPDCGDLRFADAAGDSAVPHFLASGCGTPDARAWVRVPTIATGGSWIRIFHGNPAAESASDPYATFTFHDDFLDNRNGWTYPSGWGISGGSLNGAVGTNGEGQATFPTIPVTAASGIVFTARVRNTGTAPSYDTFVQTSAGGWAVTESPSYGGFFTSHNGFGYTTRNWVDYGMTILSGQQTGTLDGVVRNSDTRPVSEVSHVRFNGKCSWSGQNIYGCVTVDAITIRKHAAEPVTAVIEESIILTVTRGPRTHEATLSWALDPGVPVENVLSYRILRGDQPDALVLVNAVTNRTTDVDPGLQCDRTYYYRVDAVVAGGADVVSRIVPAIPESTLRLLCRLNQDYPFYWGPVAHDNSHTGPDSRPDSMEAIADQEAATNEFPQWYRILPKRLHCCDVVEWDPNTLVNDGEEWTWTLDDAVAGVLGTESPIAFNGYLAKAADLNLTTTGLRFFDAPTLNAALGGRAAVESDIHFDLEGRIAKLPQAQGGGGVGGKLYLADDGTLKMSDMDSVFVNVKFGLPDLTLDKSFSKTVQVGWKKFSFPVSLSAQATLDAQLDLEALLAIEFKTGTFTPTMLARGTTLDAAATAILAGHAESGFVAGWFSTAGAATGGIATETVTPIPGQIAPTYRSPLTNVKYQDVRTPVMVFMLLPAEGSLDPLVMGARWGWLSGEVTIPWDLAFAFGGATLAFGKARIHSPTVHDLGLLGATVTSTGMAAPRDGLLAVGATDIEAGPDTPDLAVVVKGAPGSVHDVTLERPVALFDADGSTIVTTWEVVIPAVGIGPDGTAVLRVDTEDVQQRLQDLTRTGTTTAAAMAAVNGGLDTNGDGIADLAAGTTPFEGRAPAALDLRVSTMDGAVDRAHPGEHVTATLRLAEAIGDAPVAGAPVTLTTSEGATETITLGADGTGVVTLAVPADAVAPFQVRATFAGDAAHRVTDAARTLRLETRAPVIDILAPEALESVDPAATPAVEVAFKVPGANDVTSANVRLGSGSWMAAEMGADGIYRAMVPTAGLGDGMYAVTVAVEAARGIPASVDTAFAIDTKAPSVTVTQTGPGILWNGQGFSMTWTADEPVIAQVRLTNLADPFGDPIILESDTFLASGSLGVADLPQGVYNYTIAFVDSAQRAPDLDPTHVGTVVVRPGMVEPVVNPCIFGNLCCVLNSPRIRWVECFIRFT